MLVRCPLLEVKRTSRLRAVMSANDPKRTSAGISCCTSEAGFSPYQSTRLRRTMPSPELGAGHEAAGISRCSRGRGSDMAASGAGAGGHADLSARWVSRPASPAAVRRRIRFSMGYASARLHRGSQHVEVDFSAASPAATTEFAAIWRRLLLKPRPMSIVSGHRTCRWRRQNATRTVPIVSG